MSSTLVTVSFPRTGTRIAKVMDLLRECGFTVKDGEAAVRDHWYLLEASGDDLPGLEHSLSHSGFEYKLTSKVA